MSTTAERIKLGLELRDMKQADLVEKTGISKGALSSYISGRYIPKQNNIYLIAKALQVSESWLMGGDVPMERNNNPNELNIDTVPIDSGYIIPVMGRVAAGYGKEAIEEVIDHIEISPALASKGEFFGLVVKGDSMIPTICDGDTVIVQRESDAESGDLVIALVNGSDATCKRLMKYTDGLALIPINPMYEPMRFTQEEIDETPVRILGKVVELRRKF